MLRRLFSWLMSAALLLGTAPACDRPQVLVPRGEPVQRSVGAMPRGQLPGAEQSGASLYNPQQLDAILAPVALYPDVLMTQVLMASAFPLQLIEASRWVQQDNNRNLRGEVLEQELNNRTWDPSVKSLVPFPAVLAQMTANLEWLQDLGTATLQQQADVMDSVQRLRQQAQAAGNLRTTDQSIVRTGDRYIYIEPARPELVYVPAYNPVEVYGNWAYPAYPPVYLPPPLGYGWGPIVGGVVVFGTGVVVTSALWDLGRPRWRDRHIHINNHRYTTINYNTINSNRSATNQTVFHNNVWQPQLAPSFQRGGLPYSSGPAGSFGGGRAIRGGNFRDDGPGGTTLRPGGSQFRPGSSIGSAGGFQGGGAGSSGFAPGQQLHSAPVGVGGGLPPGGRGVGAPQFHSAPVGGGSPPVGGSAVAPQFHSAPVGVGGGLPPGGRGGGTPQFHSMPSGGGGGGGGAPQFRSAPSGGGGSPPGGGGGGGGRQEQHRRPGQ